MDALPLDCLFHSLVARDVFGVAQFFSDSACITLKMMIEVVRRLEMLRHRLFGQHNYLAGPSRCPADTSKPFCFSQRGRFTNVIDATRGAIVYDCKRDRSGHVVNESSRPTPSRVVFFEEDRAAAVVHSFEMMRLCQRQDRGLG